VRQDFTELGRRALHLLVDGILGDREVQPPPPVPPELIRRASAAPPR
jgi:DNA-binding LacI/PurR family transcriptional regulator